MARFDLTDAEWTIIAPLLPGAEGRKNGRPRPDDRKVLNGIFFVLRTGTPWRDLPERYGPYTTVYNRFNRWAKAGIWLRIFELLAARSPQSLQLIDSSIIRAHQHAAGGKKGGRICLVARKDCQLSVASLANVGVAGGAGDGGPAAVPARELDR